MANWSAISIASAAALALLGVGLVSLFTARPNDEPNFTVAPTSKGPGGVGGFNATIGTHNVNGAKEVRGHESSSGISGVRYGVGTGPRPGWAGDPWPKSQPMTKIASGVIGLS